MEEPLYIERIEEEVWENIENYARTNLDNVAKSNIFKTY